MSTTYTELELTALRVLADAPAGRGWALHEIGEKVAAVRGLEQHQLLTAQARARYAGQILWRARMQRLWCQDRYDGRLGGCFLTDEGQAVVRAHRAEATP